MLQDKRFLIFILAVLIITVFSGCSETADSNPDNGEPDSQYHERELSDNEALESEALDDGFGDFDEADDDIEIEIIDSEIPMALWKAEEIDLSEYAAEVLRLVNIERENAGFSDLLPDDALTAAAVTRAKELVTLFSHKRPDGSSCFTVYGENNVSYSAAAENIAAGQSTPEAVLTSWMKSPGHKANILNPDLGHLGVGAAVDSKGTIYWCQNFTD